MTAKIDDQYVKIEWQVLDIKDAKITHLWVELDDEITDELPIYGSTWYRIGTFPEHCDVRFRWHATQAEHGWDITYLESKTYNPVGMEYDMPNGFVASPENLDITDWQDAVIQELEAEREYAGSVDIEPVEPSNEEIFSAKS